MSKSPLINAFCAWVYILLGVTIIHFVTLPLKNKTDIYWRKEKRWGKPVC